MGKSASGKVLPVEGRTQHVETETHVVEEAPVAEPLTEEDLQDLHDWADDLAEIIEQLEADHPAPAPADPADFVADQIAIDRDQQLKHSAGEI